MENKASQIAENPQKKLQSHSSQASESSVLPGRAVSATERKESPASQGTTALSPDKRILYMDEDVVVVSKLPGEVCSFVDKEKREAAPYLPDVFREAVAAKAEAGLTATPKKTAPSWKTAGKADAGFSADPSKTAAPGKGSCDFLECVHRIDRPVSGCVVMARNKRALAEVSGQFTNHTTASKKYWAVVEGIIPESPEPVLLEDYLVFDTKKQKTFIVSEKSRKAKKAKLYWRSAGAGDRYSFIEVELLTGRTHQIRAQLAHAGLHIKGDVKYGARRADTIPGIRLHAREVSFISPGNKKLVKVTSPLPALDPLWEACEKCFESQQ
ncbi:MAG: RNA pseudouridine synthase [Treponemataceae bacterium]|nr:RNA pseudouridine synthase [Treponemataceae bacterium]